MRVYYDRDADVNLIKSKKYALSAMAAKAMPMPLTLRTLVFLTLRLLCVKVQQPAPRLNLLALKSGVLPKPLLGPMC